ncbi:MAG: ATP-grasp domain-containing protein [Anaerolineae bacterium]
MKVLEFEAKTLLKEHGMLIPQGEIVTSAHAAAVVAQAIGQPVVVKAQIPRGGRMKAGGVRFANTPQEAATMAGQLLGAPLLGFPVEALLVEEQVKGVAEVFVGATYDPVARGAVLLASTEGGIEVETTPKVVRRPFSVRLPAPDYLGRDMAAELGFTGAQLVGLAQLITQVGRCFAGWDALLLELNPVILDAAGRWWVADAHLELDDEAFYRQENLLARLSLSAQVADRRSDFERRAAEIDSADHRGVAGRLIPLEGSLGLLIGGGGASLTILDAILDAGLKPANYCEIGGNPSVWKIKELTKLILSQPQVERLAVIMNVVSNTRVDLVARGVIKGVLELGRQPSEAIAAFRIPGSWEAEGEAILRHYGVAFFGRETSLDQVVEAIQ